MQTYRVKVESHTTGDRHIIEVQATDRHHALEVAENFGMVCFMPVHEPDGQRWEIELSDGYTVEFLGA